MDFNQIQSHGDEVTKANGVLKVWAIEKDFTNFDNNQQMHTLKNKIFTLVTSGNSLKEHAFLEHFETLLIYAH